MNETASSESDMGTGSMTKWMEVDTLEFVAITGPDAKKKQA